jgi:hypothetical protein
MKAGHLVPTGAAIYSAAPIGTGQLMPTSAKHQSAPIGTTFRSQDNDSQLMRATIAANLDDDARMAAAPTQAEQRRWNTLVCEVATLAGILRDGLSHDPRYGPRVTRLFELVARLPIVDNNGDAE